jgi:hypothetical protein
MHWRRGQCLAPRDHPLLCDSAVITLTTGSNRTGGSRSRAVNPRERAGLLKTVPVKIMVIRCYSELEPFCQSVMMNSAAPEGTPPRRINDEKILPAVPLRGPEAGVFEKVIFLLL